ncbi:MAG: ribose-5-phosphate isomerase [Antricoccus sp.]
MRVHIGCDHAGFELKNYLLNQLGDAGYEMIDHGPQEYDPQDDYPMFCIVTAEAVAAEPGSLGLVIGGSGNGEQIAANRVAGIRAALIYSIETSTLARQHNDAQVAGLGARMHTLDEAANLAKTFLSTPFSEEPRHQRRIDVLSTFDAEHCR